MENMRKYFEVGKGQIQNIGRYFGNVKKYAGNLGRAAFLTVTGTAAGLGILAEEGCVQPEPTRTEQQTAAQPEPPKIVIEKDMIPWGNPNGVIDFVIECTGLDGEGNPKPPYTWRSDANEDGFYEWVTEILDSNGNGELDEGDSYTMYRDTDTNGNGRFDEREIGKVAPNGSDLDPDNTQVDPDEDGNWEKKPEYQGPGPGGAFR